MHGDDVSALLATLRGRASLIIAAIVIAGVLGLYVNLLQTRAKLAAVVGQVAALEGLAQAQDAAIKAQAALRAADSKAVADLVDTYRENSKRDAKWRAQLQQLERNNASVRDYLATPVPADLAGLLNASPGAGRNPN